MLLRLVRNYDGATALKYVLFKVTSRSRHLSSAPSVTAAAVAPPRLFCISQSHLFAVLAECSTVDKESEARQDVAVYADRWLHADLNDTVQISYLAAQEKESKVSVPAH